MAPPRLPFEGAITALVTPLRDGRPDERALAHLVEDQIAAGIDGLVPVGTTGEGATLEPEEQARVIRVVVERSHGRVPVIAGAGSPSTARSIELAEAARVAGADGLLLVTPYYNKPTQDGLVRHFRAVTEAVPLPTIVYNVPSRTGCDLLPETIVRLAELPAVVAIKEASGNVARTTQILSRLGDRLAVLSGDDFTAYPLYAIGARGVVSVVSNVAPRWMAEMWDAASAGDHARARALHYRIQPLTECLFSETSPIPAKCALAMMGKIADELRPPLYPMSSSGRDRLRAVLAAEGLL